MPWLSNLTIRRMFASVNVATTGFALLLASIAFVTYDVVTIHDRFVRSLTTEAQMIGYNAASALVFNDREAATATLAALRAERQILAAGIFTPEGVAFATFARNDPSAATALVNVSAGDGYKFVGDRLLVYRMIVIDGEEVGSVRLVAAMEEITASLLRHLAIGAVIFIAAIGASLPVLARLQKRISGPITELISKARIVSEQKDYSVRATSSGENELGLLVRTFNEMLAQIQERDQKLEQARDEAEVANRAKDEFLAVVSHELRTPLSPVLVWAQMLRRGEVEESRKAHAMEVIERNVRSQAQLIEDLLDVSRITTGKLRLDVRPTEIAPVVDAAVESLRPTAELKGVDIQIIADPRAIVIAGDPERLKQILWNLLSNAIKFTPKGGHVQIVAHRVNSHIEIAVSDTGRGIDSDFLPHVFDRFRQADSSSTRAHGGLGLGLSIVRHLVELHGGRVRVESGGQDQGATFTVELPMAAIHAMPTDERVHPTATTRAPASVSPVSLSGLRVLAVDDDNDTLEMLREVLEQRGAEVRTATSAARALDTLDVWQPSLLISDIGMPGEDGYSLIRKVRARDAGSGGRVPALALTAYARIEDRLKVLSAGFQMHVPKPIDPAELVAVVNSLATWGPVPERT